jgi:hypothetical protein
MCDYFFIKRYEFVLYNAIFVDLNDYLRQKLIVKPEVKKKKLGLRR